MVFRVSFEFFLTSDFFSFSSSHVQGGWTPLIWSAYRGGLEAVKLLLKRGATVNVFDYNHMTPLIFASGRGFLEITVLLLEHGAKPDTPDKVDIFTFISIEFLLIKLFHHLSLVWNNSIDLDM